jgi:hypothetical protein
MRKSEQRLLNENSYYRPSLETIRPRTSRGPICFAGVHPPYTAEAFAARSGPPMVSAQEQYENDKWNRNPDEPKQNGHVSLLLL